MLISKNWLKDFVFLPDAFNPDELALQLSLSTVEVEKVIRQGAGLEGIVVGVIRNIEKHPQADKLWLCQVDAGDGLLPIVCGGSNLSSGMKVALGQIGARVRWHGEGDLIEIKPAVIRGIESQGMICAADEIGLGQLFPSSNEREVINLSHLKAKPGTPLSTALGLDDVVFDIDNKSLTHRSDLWGHYGIAREVAALQRKKFKALNPPPIKGGKEVSVTVSVADTKLCPRYMAVAFCGIKVAPSPEWLQRRLIAVGLRPINNIVDITNYVMLELGQPLHAFDKASLASPDGSVSIFVRRAQGGEKFVTLDNKEYELNEDAMVIASQERALGLAGIKGGAGSGVTDSTTEIVFEAATFEAANIRRTSLALSLRTDSSARFEKGLDPALPELALRRAAALLCELCPGARAISAVAEERHYTLRTEPIVVPAGFIEKKLGVHIEKKRVWDILERLGFTVEEKKGALAVSSPSWRAVKDVRIPEDVVEEVARIYGYAEIPGSLPEFTIAPPPANRLRALERRVRDILAYESGLTEVYNYSFTAPEWAEKIGLPGVHLELDNPVAKDRPLLRRSLLPGLLENVEANCHRFSRVGLFEIGRTYIAEAAGERAAPDSDELLPEQHSHAGIIYAEKNLSVPFYRVAEAIRRLGQRLGADISCQAYPSMPPGYLHPGRAAQLVAGGDIVGWVGEIHPLTAKRLGLETRTAAAEIDLAAYLAYLPERDTARYEPLGVFPAVYRDVAFVVDRRHTHRALCAAIRGFDPLVSSVELFDIYAGEGVRSGAKSLGYHIAYASPERTLTAPEVDKVHAELQKMLMAVFDAQLRT
ncbi:MAG: Phenylalanine-tRNA ligase beta subunit [Candidatus Magasanikbacteria bacterium GW2011_GWA2_56_11]|uniref:Phenylalanine--tRNA ligase beta subunit n=1 Tax=Candidatus Magasanikbacteria bacterium GW2011_GWA2_56_11 TaxID=1619044 RepID=A0A0G1YHT5_9BACT|nr:MAG: Phenylalanine-tRNA ligase beta subunit [Candidatus Magasanikbacteria bacterium GW2011_GWA2_56_11]